MAKSFEQLTKTCPKCGKQYQIEALFANLAETMYPGVAQWCGGCAGTIPQPAGREEYLNTIRSEYKHWPAKLAEVDRYAAAMDQHCGAGWWEEEASYDDIIADFQKWWDHVALRRKD